MSPDPPTLTVRGVNISVIIHLVSSISRGYVDGELFFFEGFLYWEEIVLEKFGICNDDSEDKSILDVFDRCPGIMDTYLIRNHIEFESERNDKLQSRAEQRAQREQKYRQSSLVGAFVRTIAADLDVNFQSVTPSKYTRF
jgi:GTPase SAR1 family protein